MPCASWAASFSLLSRIRQRCFVTWGILNWVRECVKNIVPQWLQSYFSRNEDVCSCSTARREEAQQLENREDEHVINADEERANIHDGRITPEPTVSNTEDPAATTMPNCPPVLMTPSLHRRHLNSCMLESPALNCQPSTSSASPTGSSGFSVVNEIKDSTSQHDDGNISTTGGVCSRACAKGASQNTSAPLLWSVETERQSLSRNAATSSRTPALNVSAYRSLSQSFGKSSMPKTSHLVNSRLYPVKTRYGGAAGFIQEPKVRNTLYQVPIIQQMKPKQTSAQSYGVTSSTARRMLLQDLDKMSSPLADSKRIPRFVSYPLNSTLDRSGIVTNTDYWAKKEKVDCQYPIERLMTRKSVSVAGNRTAYFQPSLTALGELRKTNQRIDKKLSTGNETNTTRGQNREQEESVCHTYFSVCAANGLPCGEGSGGGEMNHDRMGFVAMKHPEEEIGFRISMPVEKTAELSGSSSVSEAITSGSDIGVSKNTAVPPLWPVETDHYHTLSQHTATSSKKPAFNMCRVSRIPQLIGKPSILKTRDFGDSPFYPGKTRYGGAAAVVRQPKVHNTSYQIGFRISMPVEKTAELSGSSSVSEAITSGSDIGVSKNTAVPPLWPVETDHYHTLSQHTATSSKKPAFNMCRVSRIPQLIGKPSILKTRDFGDSPFYPGKTRYGGAAAVVRQPKVHNTSYQVPVRRQMKTKQLNTPSCGVMSLTAQRILRSLEMSTPLLTLDKSGMDIAMYFQAQRQKPCERSEIGTTRNLAAKKQKARLL
ncbi:nuclear pore complex protein Nup153-like [Hipposideros larvatus]